MPPTSRSTCTRPSRSTRPGTWPWAPPNCSSRPCSESRLRSPRWPPPKTKLTEFATAVGLVYEPSRAGPLDLDGLIVPGLPGEVWRPALLPATQPGSTQRGLLLSALANGRTFRTQVLGGRQPEHVEWLGAAKSVWTSDIPRDLVVDRVWFIQTKYDSTCILNTSPGALVDDLLVDHSIEARQSWFEEVALDQLQALYETVRAGLDDGLRIASRPARDLPADVRDLDKDAKARLKTAMRSRPGAPAAEDQRLRRALPGRLARDHAALAPPSRSLHPGPTQPDALPHAADRRRSVLAARPQRARAGPPTGHRHPHVAPVASSCGRSTSSTPTPASPRSTGAPRSSSATAAPATWSKDPASCAGRTAGCRAIPSARCRSRHRSSRCRGTP